MEIRHTQLASLGCRVIQSTPAPKLGVVLCHGFGAPGTDLVPLGEELLALQPNLQKDVAFVFPEAPLELLEFGGGARAWWRIDMMRMQMLDTSSPDAVDTWREHVAEGLPEARRRLMAFLSELTVQWKLPWNRLVLGGFSQGAMLSTEVALRLEESPAALAIFSGTLIHRSDWKRRAAARNKLPVLVSHGQQDPILPFTEAEALVALFREAGMNVDFLPFPGPHTIALPALRRFSELLLGLASEGG
jgi:phospholipase/carboxylesterase